MVSKRISGIEWGKEEKKGIRGLFPLLFDSWRIKPENL